MTASLFDMLDCFFLLLFVKYLPFREILFLILSRQAQLIISCCQARRNGTASVDTDYANHPDLFKQATA